MKKSILVVEDNAADRKIISRYINAFETAVDLHFCASLTEAQSWLNTQSPDILLLDLNLPDSTDTDTLLIVSKLAKTMPIIVLTGHDSQSMALKSIQQGFQDFLRKGEFDERILEKSILFSMERYAILKRLDSAHNEISQLNKALETKVLERTQDLADSQRELVKHLHIRENFIRNITHEVRTPLTGILGAIQLMENRALSEDMSILMGIIQESSVRIHHFFESVLDDTLTQSDGIVLINTPFEIETLQKEIMAYAQNVTKSPNVRIETHITPSTDATVKGDRYHIIKMVKHLINNAAQYTESGQISVTCRSETDQDKRYLSFEIANTGDPLSSETADQLMGPFIQGGDKTHQFHGAGLGLTLSKKLAEMMNGGLRFSHDPIKGNIFSAHICLDIQP